MDNIIKQIRKIIGADNSNYINIHIAENEIWMYIFETEVPLIIDLKKKEVYVDCESSKHHLDYEMLDELGQICKLLKKNLDTIEDLLKFN